MRHCWNKSCTGSCSKSCIGLLQKKDSHVWTVSYTHLIAAGALYDGDFWDFFIGRAKVEKALKVAVVLTIPAAGSEGSAIR